MPSRKASNSEQNTQEGGQVTQQPTQQAQTEQQVQVQPFIMRLAQRIAQKRGISIEEALDLISKYWEPPDYEGPLSREASDLKNMLIQYAQAKMFLSDLAGGDGKFESAIADVKATISGAINQLQAQIDELRKALADVIERQKQMSEEKVLNLIKDEVNKQLSPLTETLKKLEQYIAEDVQRKSQQQVQEILKPILDKLEELETRVSTVEKTESKEVTGLKEQVSQLRALLNEAKEALESLGYRVEGAKPITQEDLQKAIEQAIESLSPEKLKEIAEKKGLMVVDPRLPIDQVQKLIEEAKQRGYQEAMQQNVMNSIKDFVDIVTNVAERLLPRFGPYMSDALRAYAQRQVAAQAVPTRPQIIVEETKQAAQQAVQQATQAAQTITQSTTHPTAQATGTAGGAQ